MAYEIARQLRAEGQEIDLLIAIDIATPTPHKYVRRAMSFVGRLLHQGEDKQLNWFLRYVYARIPSFKIKVDNSLAEKSVKDDSNNSGVDENSRNGQVENRRNKIGIALAKLKAYNPSVEALRHQWSGIYRWVVAGYVPGPYAGKLTLFWSSEGFTEKTNWRQISGSQKVEDHVFPGTHMSCQNENLHILAERLSQCLNEVQEVSSVS